MTDTKLERIPGEGWLALLGGGEFSFGETLEADGAWLSKAAEGVVGFLPTASGSNEYGDHFAEYLLQSFEREVSTVPIYRSRDARRGKNLQRLEDASAVYLGGGVADDLMEVLQEESLKQALGKKITTGGVVVLIAAAAQTAGEVFRSLTGGEAINGLGWLPGGVVETNFDPGHDRRLRSLMSQNGIHWGLGLPAGSALLLGPEGVVESVGISFLLTSADGDFEILK
jgi:cyanophycinase-like exopeptidase